MKKGTEDMICPNCSQELKDESKFCPKCGKKIPRCPTCGKVLTRRLRFCINDGTPIPEEELALLPEEPVKKTELLKEAAPVEKAEPVEETRSGVELGTDEFELEEEETEKGGKKNGLLLVLIIILLVLLLAAAGAVGYIVVKGKLASAEKTVTESGDDDDADLIDRSGSDEEAVEEHSEEAKAAEDSIAEDEAGEQEEEKTEEEQKVEVIHTYEVISADISWQDALNACEEKGGHLATITSEEEYEEICELASESGLTYLWLGAALHSEEDEWEDDSWITGEKWSFDYWYPGEPSKEDEDGTKEYCLCLWNAKYDGNDIGWTFNDQRNDIVGAFSSVSGKVGYICEYETEVTE